MRFLRRSLVGLFLLAVTVGLVTYAGQSFYAALQTRLAQQDRPRPARERVFAANVVTVSPQQIVPVMTAFGEVRSRRTLAVRAKAGGTVIELADSFVEGGQVTAGQRLLQVDPSDAQSALDVARADLDEAEAELRDAGRGLELAEDELNAAQDQASLQSRALTRQQNLRERGVGTDAAVEAAELSEAAAKQAVLSRRQAVASAHTRVDQAQTRLSRTRIALAEAERDLADTALYAAFSGTLGSVSLVQGGLVANNEQVAELIDPADLEASFRVSTAQYARLLDDAGALRRSEVQVTLDVFGTDLIAKGRIIRESAAVGEGQTGRLLFARLEAAKGFRPGDFVTIEVQEAALDNVTLLPASAVDAAGTVLVVGDDDRLELAQVQVLRRQGDDVILRAPDLSGREVVTGRTPLLGAGIKIRPIRPGAAADTPEKPEMVALTPERRAQLIAFVEGNTRMPPDAKERVLAQLAQDEVSAQTVARLESRMGG